MIKLRRVKYIAAFLVTVVLLAAVTGCASNSEEENTSDVIRLGVYTGGADHIMAIVGQEEGIFKKYGLQVEITEFATGLNTVDAIVTNQSDIGLITDYAGINRIGSTKEDCNIKIIARYTTADDYWKFYVNSETVSKNEDLAQQGVTNVPGTLLEYYNSVVFDYANITESDRKLLNVDSEQMALGILSNNEASAGWLSSASVSKAEDMGLVQFFTMKDLNLTVDAYYVAADSS